MLIAVSLLTTRRLAIVFTAALVLGFTSQIIAQPGRHRDRPQRGQTREYFIQAEEVDWDYAPWYPGPNPVFGTPQDALDEGVFLADGIGDTYRKAVYREYADGSYSTKVERPAYLGTLGPIIRGEVGDTIVVHLKNAMSRNVSLHPHGVLYKKDSEGAFYDDGTSGPDKGDDVVAPGGSHDYVWKAPEARRSCTR